MRLRDEAHPFPRLCYGVVFLLLSGMIWGCGASSPYYKHADDRPAARGEGVELGDHRFTLFLIGDTGDPSTDPLEPNLGVLQHHLAAAGEQSAVVFLGDNIYNYGLLPEGHPDRSDSERRIDTQLQLLSEYRGHPVFIPGNHDWNHDEPGGLEAILRQQAYIRDRLGATAFAPRDGCPGPSELPLGPDHVLLLIDTQWWLYPHEKPAPEDCAAGTREQFVQVVDSLARHYDSQDINIIVAGHHPLYSNGTHGGHFPVEDHLFPLLKYHSSLYLPLPVIGSINPLYRRIVGYRQDLAGKEYRQLRVELTRIFRRHGDLVYASGHEHSLQYHPIGDQHYVTAGSGTVQSYVRRGKTADFVYSHKGFARVDVNENGTVLSFWTPGGERPGGRMVYQTLLYEH
ncbi:hypothetical protein [Fodinibius sp.]|uniref:hypothetical protein n=1 Tax=Fodinibius sp. TaxID=1872440 RepID=UPI0035667891